MELTRKINVLVSEYTVLIDGGVVETDLRPRDGRKITLLKPKGVRSGGTAFAAIHLCYGVIKFISTYSMN